MGPDRKPIIPQLTARRAVIRAKDHLPDSLGVRVKDSETLGLLTMELHLTPLTLPHRLNTTVMPCHLLVPTLHQPGTTETVPFIPHLIHINKPDLPVHMQGSLI
jgi:hypothetical protein